DAVDELEAALGADRVDELLGRNEPQGQSVTMAADLGTADEGLAEALQAIFEGARASWPTDEELTDEQALALQSRLGESYRPERPESFSERKARDEWDLPDEEVEPPDEADQTLPVGSGDVEVVEAADGATTFFFDVAEAWASEDMTQIVFEDFQEDYELLVNMPAGFDGELNTLADLEGLDLGDGQLGVVDEVTSFGREEIQTGWGQDGGDTETAVTLDLMGVTDASQIDVEVM
ncbi:hypothetical protein LRD18_12570, partial [Halorhodospira halochloris]|uniref:hypothetical protein n=1 Tax=Halorhodospira halochloris TaxID=1052 RepID=UPI001EE7FC4A